MERLGSLDRGALTCAELNCGAPACTEPFSKQLHSCLTLGQTAKRVTSIGIFQALMVGEDEVVEVNGGRESGWGSNWLTQTPNLVQKLLLHFC